MCEPKLNFDSYRNIGAPDHVLDWIREGVKIPFETKPNKCFFNNRVKNRKEEVFIDQEISKLLEQRTVAKVNYKPKCILAIQCVPKKGGKLRLVLDCRPINRHINSPKFTQEGIAAVSDLIECDDELVTIDLKDGFHHVGIHKHFQTYVGFKWRGEYFVWQFLPFGIACAPYFFNKVLQPVVEYLRVNDVRVAPFVDDFLIMENQSCMTDRRDFTVQVFEELGWRLNYDKCQLQPRCECLFVGFLISTMGKYPWIKVMPEKIRKLRRSINSCLDSNIVTARYLARIIGQCIAMAKAILPGKLLLRNCYKDLRQKTSWDSTIHLSEASKKDLIWWRDAVRSWNGAPICNKSIDLQIATDASHLGWGAVIQGTDIQASGAWNKHVSYRHSNYRELLAVLMAVQSFRKEIKGNTTKKHVQILSDNITTVAYINKMGGSSTDLTRVMTTLWSTANELNIVLSARYLAGRKNLEADRLSRRDSPYDWMLHPRVFQSLDRLWGPHTIDRFAAAHNTQVRRFNSLYWDPCTEGVDALAQKNWQQENNFCNPPFWMLPKVLETIKIQKAEATVIVPWWKKQRWFQKLTKMLIDYPIQLKNHHRTMMRRGARPEPWKNRKWRIFACRVSGNSD